MAAEHVCETAGLGFTMDTLLNDRSSGHALASLNAQRPTGPCLGYNQSHFDSGFFETRSSNAHSYQSKPIKLLDWQDQILRLWSAHNHHVSSDTDIILFRVLLRASEDSIKVRLQELFENNQVLNKTSAYITSNISYNTTNSQSSQESVNLPEEGVTILQPGIKDDLAMFNDIAMCGSCDLPRGSFELKEQISPSQLIVDSRYPKIHSHGQAFSSQKRMVPPSTDSCLTVSGNTSMETSSMSLYPTIYYPATIFGSRNNLLSSNLDRPNTVVMYNGEQHPTKALMHLIRTVIRQKKEKGCGPLQGHGSQTGAYPCTIGCARRFKSSCDLFRHEEIVHPQHFWFCFLCGDTSAPSEKHLFTREDKTREHIKRFHPFGFHVAQFKVLHVRTTFPERCKLCLHHRHRSWKDRRRHIIMHCKRREDLSISNRRTQALPVINDGDDDDDDDGDDDGDDGGDNGNGDGQDDDNDNDGDSQDFSNDHSHNDEGGDRSQNGPEDPHFDNEPGADDFLGMCHWDSPGSWNFPSSIKFRPLLPETGPSCSGRMSIDLTMQWLKRVNRKGGTASVFKVALPIDLETGTLVGKKTYAVKQYHSNMRSSYERELKVFTALAERKVDSSSFVRCFGTFEYTKPSGQFTFNLILEYGECDLHEYFADTPRPILKEGIYGFWKSLFGIADGLHQLHKIGGVHGDIKPDNILRVYDDIKPDNIFRHGDLKPEGILTTHGSFKLGDFGFTEFFQSHNLKHRSKQHFRGGTLAYAAPEASRIAVDNACVSPSMDMWSLGCVLSEAVTWVVFGFQGLRAREKRLRLKDASSLRTTMMKWHEHVRSNVRKSDGLTIRVLDLIDEHLLQENPALRPSSTRLLDLTTTALCETWDWTLDNEPERSSCLPPVLGLSLPCTLQETNAMHHDSERDLSGPESFDAHTPTRRARRDSLSRTTRPTNYHGGNVEDDMYMDGRSTPARQIQDSDNTYARYSRCAVRLSVVSHITPPSSRAPQFDPSLYSGFNCGLPSLRSPITPTSSWASQYSPPWSPLDSSTRGPSLDQDHDSVSSISAYHLAFIDPYRYTTFSDSSTAPIYPSFGRGSDRHMESMSANQNDGQVRNPTYDFRSGRGPLRRKSLAIHPAEPGSDTINGQVTLADRFSWLNLSCSIAGRSTFGRLADFTRHYKRHHGKQPTAESQHYQGHAAYLGPDGESSAWHHRYSSEDTRQLNLNKYDACFNVFFHEYWGLRNRMQRSLDALLGATEEVRQCSRSQGHDSRASSETSGNGCECTSSVAVDVVRHHMIPIMSYRRGVAHHRVSLVDRVNFYTTTLVDSACSSSLTTAHSLEGIAEVLDQYLSGRQEHPTTILIPTDAESHTATYDALKHLLSEFWHSPRRRAFHNNLRIHFMSNEGDRQMEQLESMFPFVDFINFRLNCYFLQSPFDEGC